MTGREAGVPRDVSDRMNARVSVVIPTYNHANYLPQAIESVLAQTRPSHEIIVVDDGSTDGTADLMRRYPQVHYWHRRHAGTAAALNTGIRKSTGDWICWLSADDLFLPKKLEVQLSSARDHPNAGLLYSDFYTVDASGAQVLSLERPPSFPDRAAWRSALLGSGCLINGITTMIRRRVLYAAGLFIPELELSQDYNMWIRLAPLCDFAYIPQPLAASRLHPGNREHRLDTRFRQRARELI